MSRLNMTHPLVSGAVGAAADLARRSGLRTLVSRFPAIDGAWRRARGVVEPPPSPAVTLPRFRALLKERYQVADLDTETDPLKRMYLDFALSTVARGEVVREFVRSLRPVEGARYLDVGCAYGGFPVAFARGGAAEVVGVELNPQLLDYAREVMADTGVACTLLQGDVLDPGIGARLGTFDLVTCNDVIEHVKDPRAALAALVGLLRPGGVLVLEIPNRFVADAVLSDGHYQLFGLTTLPRGAADRYFAAARGAEHDVVYRSLDWYVHVLERLGVTVSIHNETGADTEARLARAGAVFDEVAHRARTGVLPVSGPLEGQLRRSVLRVCGLFHRAHGRWRALRATDPQAAAELGRRLELTFHHGFWRVVVRR